ncbi:hypothetical protein [Leptothermofonsia sp. ETS-13]|uniref:hypothetical protein n=1 Tax=Leptothermofonsia sp. ETS-13 TaxID=3035696 RepID=UPI003B9E5EDC
MSKLTESLKATAEQLKQIKHGISQMRELGQELSDNTVQVVDAALRTGYAYAKAEAENGIVQPEPSFPVKSIAPTTTNILALNELRSSGGTCWTAELLKTQFGGFNEAYRYLRNCGFKLSQRSWKTVIDTFNGNLVNGNLDSFNKSSDRKFNKSPDSESSILQRIAHLEQAIFQQERRIVMIEEKLNQALQQLQQIAIVAE